MFSGGQGTSGGIRVSRRVGGIRHEQSYGLGRRCGLDRYIVAVIGAVILIAIVKALRGGRA
ncbi:MAG: GlsB/YeaQ/YmgE family stress response membrane protein [Aestuariivirga sp.]